MANVAMLRLESVTRFSRSRLQAVTADGCFMATCRGSTGTSGGTQFSDSTYMVSLARGPLGTTSTPLPDHSEGGDLLSARPAPPLPLTLLRVRTAA